jgi:hypothetical protein
MHGAANFAGDGHFQQSLFDAPDEHHAVVHRSELLDGEYSHLNLRICGTRPQIGGQRFRHTASFLFIGVDKISRNVSLDGKCSANDTAAGA